jgi:hypothetical protein
LVSYILTWEFESLGIRNESNCMVLTFQLVVFPALTAFFVRCRNCNRPGTYNIQPTGKTDQCKAPPILFRCNQVQGQYMEAIELLPLPKLNSNFFRRTEVGSIFV